jgi:hypothetical protein
MHNYPNAFISTQNGPTRNRLKLYTNNTVWLNNGDEYQIEFENYTQRNFLAKIKIDGQFISDSGLILKPGQHIYLDRYFDSPRRFKFSTYSVENTAEAKSAIQNNGWVEIYFYEQLIHFQPTISWTYTNQWFPQYPVNDPFFGRDISGSARGFDADAGLYGAGRYGYKDMSINCCNNVSDDLNAFHGMEKSIETGRTEQGSVSNQTFKMENMEFNSWHSQYVVYKIVPFSAVAGYSTVRNYCTSCSYRVRDGKWIYCPKCGNRI